MIAPTDWLDFCDRCAHPRTEHRFTYGCAHGIVTGVRQTPTCACPYSAFNMPVFTPAFQKGITA